MHNQNKIALKSVEQNTKSKCCTNSNYKQPDREKTKNKLLYTWMLPKFHRVIHYKPLKFFQDFIACHWDTFTCMFRAAQLTILRNITCQEANKLNK